MYYLRLYLSPIDEKRFKVIVTDSPVGEKEADSELPFFDGHTDRRITVMKALEAVSFRPQDFLDKAEQDWMIQAGLLTIDRQSFLPEVREWIGQKLYRALFPEGSEVREILQNAIAVAQDGGEPTLLHVQITIEADAARQGRARLADYPWELVCDERGFLASRQVAFSRYIAFNDVPPNLTQVEQINILQISSSAFDLAHNLLQFSNQDRQAIHDGLKKAESGNIQVLELKPPTFSNLRAYLTEQHGQAVPHVIHFDGHGFFGKRCNHVGIGNQECGMIYSDISATHCKLCGTQLPSHPQGFLLFEDGSDGPHYISAHTLGDLLQNVKVALVVLSACRSGFSQGSVSVFNGVAQSLISHRVPAVVAMQYKVSVTAAAAFAEQFYRSLGQRLPLVRAVNWGREAVGLEGNQWYRPVLYLRWQDNAGGQLFKVVSSNELEVRELNQIQTDDRIINVLERISLTLGAQQATDVTRRGYLEWLIRENSYSVLLGISEFQYRGRSPIRIDLNKGYISLEGRRDEMPGVEDRYLSEQDSGELKAKMEVMKEEMTKEALPIHKIKQYKQLFALESRLKSPEGRLGGKLELTQAVKDHEHLIILGEPGSGKTTFLKYLALRHAQAFYNHRVEVDTDLGKPKFPILIRILDYAKDRAWREKPLSDFLADYCHRHECPRDGLANLLSTELDKGDCLVLFDGLDEIANADDRRAVAERIDDFVGRYAKNSNHFVITSRTAGFRIVEMREPFIYYVLQPMDEPRISQFLGEWCLAIETVLSPNLPSNTRIMIVQQKINIILNEMQTSSDLRRLISNPLLCILIILNCTSTLPTCISPAFLRQGTSTLARTWRIAQGIPASDLVLLEDPLLILLLSKIAGWLRSNSPIGIAKVEEVHDILDEAWANISDLRWNKDFPNPFVVSKVNEYLVTVSEHTGLFVERAPKLYGFVYSPFEHYYADRRSDPASKTKIIGEHLKSSE